MNCSVRWLAAAAGLLAGACGNPFPVVDDGAAYDPDADPFSDPPSLYELYPVAEPGRALSDTTVVRHDFSQPATLNPLFPSGAASAWTMFGMLFEWLVIRHGNPSDYDWNTNVVREARWSEDLLSVTLNLNPDLRWHDGEPWTAADVAFSLEALRDERVPVSFWPTARDLVVGATAEGEHRVRFDFAGLLAPQLRLEALAFPIMPRHILGDPAERAADPTLRSSPYYNRYGREAVIGSGPFRFVEWRNNDRVVLERWEDHYLFESAPPAAKTMIFKFQPDRNLAFLQFLGGEYDQTYVDANIFARQATGPLFEERAVKGRHASALLLCIVWNMDGSNPFFADPLVRRALAHAYDAETVLRRVGHGLYRRSYGFMVEERWDYEPAILERPYDYDLARAAELLDQAGWLADPDTGWRHKEIDGERVRFSFELSYTAGLTYVPPTLDILREDFRRLGGRDGDPRLRERLPQREASRKRVPGARDHRRHDPGSERPLQPTGHRRLPRRSQQRRLLEPQGRRALRTGQAGAGQREARRDLPGDPSRGVPGPAGAVPVPRQFPLGLRQRRPRRRTRPDGDDPAVADAAGRLAVADRPGLVAGTAGRVSSAPFIPTPDEVSAGWLTEQLRAAGHEVEVVGFDAADIGTGQLGRCIRYRFDYRGDSAGAPRTLVGKFPSDDPISRQTGVVLRNYIKEVRFYRELQPRLSISTPRCYFAEIVADALGLDAADGRHLLGGKITDVLRQGVEPRDVGLDVLPVVEPLGDDHVQQRIEERDVGAGIELEHVGGVALQGLAPGVHHDEGRLLGRLLEEGGGNRVVLGGIGADDDDDVGVVARGERGGHRTRADAFEQRRDRRRVAQPRTVIDVVGAEALADHLLDEVRLLVRALGGAEAGERRPAGAVADGGKPARGAVERLLPGRLAEVGEGVRGIDLAVGGLQRVVAPDEGGWQGGVDGSRSRSRTVPSRTGACGWRDRRGPAPRR